MPNLAYSEQTSHQVLTCSRLIVRPWLIHVIFVSLRQHSGLRIPIFPLLLPGLPHHLSRVIRTSFSNRNRARPLFAADLRISHIIYWNSNSSQGPVKSYQISSHPLTPQPQQLDFALSEQSSCVHQISAWATPTAQNAPPQRCSAAQLGLVSDSAVTVVVGNIIAISLDTLGKCLEFYFEVETYFYEFYVSYDSKDQKLVQLIHLAMFICIPSGRRGKGTYMLLHTYNSIYVLIWPS